MQLGSLRRLQLQVFNLCKLNVLQVMFSLWSLDLWLLLLLLLSPLLPLPFFMLLQVLLQGLQGPGTVGNRVFDSRIQLSIGLIKAFGLKDWVPAKVLPPTCWNNCSLQKCK